MPLGLRLGFASPRTPTPDNAPKTIFFFGDSITAQLGTSSGESSSVITNITRASPAVVTWPGHLLNSGDLAYFWGVQGMTELNENSYTVTKIDANSFSINVDSTGFAPYLRYGKAFRTHDAGFSKATIGYATTLQLYSNQRYAYHYRNKRGIIADSSSSLVLRKDVELTPGLGIDIVCLLVGTNDITTGVSNAALQANILSIIQHVTVALGAVMILGTVPPRDADSAALKDQREQHNQWVRQQASGKVVVWDFYDSVTDAATRSWKPGFSSDGIHPSALGAAAMGKKLHQCLLGRYGYGPGLKPASGNVLVNPALAGTGGSATGVTNGSAGLAANWTATLTGTTALAARSVSKAAGDEQIIDVNFPAGSGTHNAITLKQEVLAASLSAGSDYVAEAEIVLESVSGSGPLTQFSLTVANQTITLSSDHGPYSGSPIEPLAADDLQAASQARPLFFRTLPVRLMPGHSKLVVGFTMKFNNTTEVSAARLRIRRIQLFPI